MNKAVFILVFLVSAAVAAATNVLILHIIWNIGLVNIFQAFERTLSELTYPVMLIIGTCLFWINPVFFLVLIGKEFKSIWK